MVAHAIGRCERIAQRISGQSLSVVFIALGAQACMFGPVDGVTMKEPKDAPADTMMQGDWVLDHYSQGLIKEHYGDSIPEVRLTLHADHRFEATAFPDFVTTGDGGPAHHEFLDGKGAWGSKKFEGEWWITMNYDTCALYPRGCGTMEHLFVNKGEIVIWMFIGDPDSGDRLLFRKKDSRTKDPTAPA